MKTILLALTIFGCAFVVNAQDTVNTIRGSRLIVNIKKNNSFEIFYTVPEWPNSKPKAISKSEIANISYADGKRDTFFVMDGAKINSRSPLLKSDSLYFLGRKDASKFYSRSNGAAIGTLLATFPGSPVVGLITAIATGATPPQEKNLDFPNGALAANKNYRDGYEAKAWKIRKGRVWGAYGFGLLATCLFVGFLEMMQH